MAERAVFQSRLHIWLLAARPKTLPAAVVPVIIGSTMALDVGAFHWPSFAAILLSALFIQIGTNFANDLFDYQKKVDTSDRIGPLRVTQAGLVTPSTMKAATILVFSCALLLGIYVVIRGGWPIVIIGLSSIAFGVLYTGGPLPLGYLGLGDLLVMIFFGPVATGGTYYVMTQSIDSQVVISGLAPGLLSVAILTVNNLRDLDTDARTGKRSLAVRFGRGFARAEYMVSICVAALIPVITFVIRRDHPWSMLALLIIPVALRLFNRVLRTAKADSLNRVLASTGHLLLLYGLLFSVGWLL